jgi:uncharacterized protein (DUF58 family)
VLLPFALLNQLVTPHPVWVVLVVVLGVLYALAIVWVRVLATALTIDRRRLSTILVAGDELEERFTLHNESALPLLWAEVQDESTIPAYQPGRVVGAGGHARLQWQSALVCQQRGVYRLGPHRLTTADPLGFFQLTVTYPQTDTVVIYPRVLQLPPVLLPQGAQSGAARRRRPLLGTQPAATVRTYQETDSLRYVHWPLTAHRGLLMVKELESEPAGAVWIVLDLDQAQHRGRDAASTLELAVTAAASLAAALLQENERRAVGLFTISGRRDDTAHQVVMVPPQSSQAQLWNMLSALAAVQPTDVTLAEQLASVRTTLSMRNTLMVITAQPAAAPAWPAALLHLQSIGVNSSVLLIDDETAPTAAALEPLLARYGIEIQRLLTSQRLPPALTFRRTRRVIRSTPTGGAVSYEVEEEVG